MVRSRCIRSGNLCQGNKSIGRRSNARCSSGTRSLGSCRRSGTGCCSGACPHAEGFQHEQHGTGSRWWSGDGLGQHAHECLPLPRLSVLRQNERREVHDGGASQSRRCACGSRQGLRAIVNQFQNCIASHGRSSLWLIRRTPFQALQRCRKKMGGRFYWNAAISSAGNRLANDFGARGFCFTSGMN
jgi:hypothetical protein